MNPYAVLEVEQSADKAMIKRAFKTKAKQVHPDMPKGNAKQFALVRKAFDVLSDDARRAKYDTTGDIDENTPDNALSQAVNYLAQALDVVLGSCAQAGKSPLEVDLVHEMRKVINKGLSDMRSQKRTQKNIFDTDKKLKGRFEKKKKSATPDIFEQIVDYRLISVKEKLRQLETNIKAAEDAKGMLEEFVYKYNEPKQMSEREERWASMGIQFV